MSIKLAEALITITTLGVATTPSHQAMANYRLALRVVISYITILARGQPSDNACTMPAVREALAYLKEYGIAAYKDPDLRSAFDSAWALIDSDPALNQYKQIAILKPDPLEEFFNFQVDLPVAPSLHVDEFSADPVSYAFAAPSSNQSRLDPMDPFIPYDMSMQDLHTQMRPDFGAGQPDHSVLVRLLQKYPEGLALNRLLTKLRAMAIADAGGVSADGGQASDAAEAYVKFYENDWVADAIVRDASPLVNFAIRMTATNFAQIYLVTPRAPYLTVPRSPCFWSPKTGFVNSALDFF